jgi:acyl-CoA synthetase (AMP-forming)/AMP-acid ligase II
MQNIGDLIAFNASRTPRQYAVGMRDGTLLTYAELHLRTSKLANALISSGLQPGDRVAAWVDDSVEFFEIYIASLKAGLVVVPINYRYRVHEAKFQLQNTRSAALFYSSIVSDLVPEVAEEIRFTLLVAVNAKVHPKAVDYHKFLEKGHLRELPSVDTNAPAIIAFTSGTTGYPKGAVLTHRAILEASRSQCSALRIPMYGVRGHTASMAFSSSVVAGLFSTMFAGGCSILFSRGWSPDDLLDSIERFKITNTSVSSPLVEDITKALKHTTKSWASLQSVAHGSSKGDALKLRRLAEVVEWRFVEIYGMTENSGSTVTATTIFDLQRSDLKRDLFTSAGRAVNQAQMAIVDVDGRPLAHDGESIGEVVIQTPFLMSGYWENEQATRAAIRNGWYYTGDMGSVDQDGYLYIVERRADLIVSGGMNVYPAEVETTVLAIEGVKECAVVGAAHSKWGQTVVAFVVLNEKSGGHIREEAIIDFCKSRLASYKKPTMVFFVDELPRNIAGKVLTQELRDRASNAMARN